MKNFKALLVIPFFFYATLGYMKAFQIVVSQRVLTIFVLLNLVICVGLMLADYQLFGESDADGFYTQAVLLECLYLLGGAGLNLFSGLERN